MSRKWNQVQIAEFNAKRDKERAEQGLSAFAQLSETEKKATLANQRSDLLKSTLQNMISTSWAIERFPLSAHNAPTSGTLELPRNYLSTAGTDTIKFHKGENLAVLTYQYYDEIVDPKSHTSPNYLDSDNAIHPKRHEYLGPRPKVAGYRLSTRGVVEPLFWDQYLETRWSGKRSWEVELVFDSVVESWFVNEFK